MTREQIVDTAYKAMMRLNLLKAKYGVIPQQMAEAENQRLEAAGEMVHIIDDILSRGDHPEELVALKTRIDQLNLSPMTHWQELKLPLGRTKLKLLRSLWSWATERI
jgi:hypothetical protein